VPYSTIHTELTITKNAKNMGVILLTKVIPFPGLVIDVREQTKFLGGQEPVKDNHYEDDDDRKAGMDNLSPHARGR
jgi:hypothetical protein